jgi:hypothetical protein
VDETIYVDLETAENNGDFLVIPFTNFQNTSGHLINGFIIEPKNVDFRHVMESKYKAILRPNLNQVLIYTPAIPFAFLHEAKLVYAKQLHHNQLCERGKDGREIFKHAMLGDDERQIKCIILQFPEEFELTCEFSSKENKSYGDIQPVVTPITSVYKVAGKERKMTDVFLQWTVHKLEDEPRVAVYSEEANDVNDAAAQLASRLAGMDFGEDM